MLRPDEWNNIPVPIVNTIRMIINVNEQNFQQLKSLETKFELVRNNSTSQNVRLDREMTRKDEMLRRDMLNMHKELVTKIENGHAELKQEDKALQKSIDTNVINLQSNIINVDKKVIKLNKDFAQMETNLKEHVETLNFKANLIDSTINKRIDDLISEHFGAPENSDPDAGE